MFVRVAPDLALEASSGRAPGRLGRTPGDRVHVAWLFPAAQLAPTLVLLRRDEVDLALGDQVRQADAAEEREISWRCEISLRLTGPSLAFMLRSSMAVTAYRPLVVSRIMASW